MNDASKKQVFLCYASDDIEIVQKIYTGLCKRNLDVWFDKEDLKPGAWMPQVMKAISRSRYFIICISKMALRKIGDESPGFQDKELNRAYEIAISQPDSHFTIVPVRIEDCDRGGHDVRLTSFQQYDLFKNFRNGLDKLALDLGGISLADVKAKDTRTEDDKSAESLLGKASALYLTGAESKALEIYDTLIALDPRNFVAWYSKGAVLDELGRFEEALEAYEKAIEINPDSANAWANKGFTLSHFNSPEDELTAYNRSLDIQPNNTAVLFNIGVVLVELERYDEAIKTFDKLLEISPKDNVVKVKKGKALKHIGLGGNYQSILLENLLTLARESVKADAASIYIRYLDWLYFAFFENVTLMKRLSNGEIQNFDSFKVPVNESSIAGYVATNGHSLNIKDVYNLDPATPYKFSNKFDTTLGYRTQSILTVPINSDTGHNLGVIQIYNAQDESGRIINFTDADEIKISHFASIAAEALKF
jgi:tetratricopeptide (TPR) repeat protein